MSNTNFLQQIETVSQAWVRQTIATFLTYAWKVYFRGYIMMQI